MLLTAITTSASSYSQSKIENWESKYQVALPAELRAWLLEVGRGAGPYYGLLPDGLTSEPFSGNLDEYSSGDILDLSEFTQAHAAEHIRKLEANEKRDDIDNPYVHTWISSRTLRNGLKVSDRGCNQCDRIILAGPCSGLMVFEYEELVACIPDDEEMEDAETAYLPLGTNKKIPHVVGDALEWQTVRDPDGMFGFFDYMEHWLDVSLALAAVDFRGLEWRRRKVKALNPN